MFFVKVCLWGDMPTENQNEQPSYGRRLTPEELRKRVEEAGDFVGEPFFASVDELHKMLGAESLEALRQDFPAKSAAYEDARFGREQARHFAPYMRMINNLERFMADIEADEANTRLYSYQIEVFRDLRDKLFNQGRQQGWIKLPTGAGKTAVFCSLTKAVNARTLILVPKKDLVTQTVASLQNFAPGIEVGTYYSKGRKDASKQITVSTYQSLGTLLREHGQDLDYDLVICDEAHRALSGARQATIDELAAVSNNRVMIGLTATPEFHENKTVSHYFGELIHEMTINEAIHADVLSGVRCSFVLTPNTLSTDSSGRDYSDAELEHLNEAQRNEAAVRILEQFGNAVPSTAMFCLSIGHSQYMADLLNRRGISAAHVDGGTPDDVREAIYHRFRQGDIKVICSVDLLTEGWDAPNAELGINLRPTRSRVVAEQRGGRLIRKYTRPDGSRKFAWIIDFIDQIDEDTYASITMVDVLAGAVEVPAGTESPGHQGPPPPPPPPYESIDLEGFELVTNVEQILAIQSQREESRVAKESAALASKEEYAVILKESFPDISLIIRRPGFFREQRIEHPTFRGRGEGLIRRYFKNVHGDPDRKVNMETLVQFLDEVIGEGHSKQMRESTIKEMAPGTLRKFLEQHVGEPLSELLDEPIGGVHRLQATAWKLGTPTTLREVLEVNGITDISEESMQAFMVQLQDRSPSGSDLTEHWVRRRREHVRVLALAQSGELAQIITQLPNLILLTPQRFALQSLVSNDGLPIAAPVVLAHYGVSSLKDYYVFLDDLFGEGYVEQERAAIVREVSELLKHVTLIQPTTSLAEFLNRDLVLESRQSSISGRHLFTLLEKAPSHKAYRDFVNELSGNPSFCREFWPNNRLIVRGMVLRALSQHQDRTSSKGGNLPNLHAFGSIPLLQSDAYQYFGNNTTFKVHTCGDVLRYWVGTRQEPDTTIYPIAKAPSQHDYDQFIDWISKPPTKRT